MERQSPEAAPARRPEHGPERGPEHGVRSDFVNQEEEEIAQELRVLRWLLGTYSRRYAWSLLALGIARNLVLVGIALGLTRIATVDAPFVTGWAVAAVGYFVIDLVITYARRPRGWRRRPV